MNRLQYFSSSIAAASVLLGIATVSVTSWITQGRVPSWGIYILFTCLALGAISFLLFAAATAYLALTMPSMPATEAVTRSLTQLSRPEVQAVAESAVPVSATGKDARAAPPVGPRSRIRPSVLRIFLWFLFTICILPAVGAIASLPSWGLPKGTELALDVGGGFFALLTLLAQMRIRGAKIAMTCGLTLAVAAISYSGHFIWKRSHDVLNRQLDQLNLRLIGLAFDAYEQKYRSFPLADGQLPGSNSPAVSWRVLILPFLDDPEAANLYADYHQNEPWDSPHNSQLVKRMPKTFALPGKADAQPGHTFYRAFVSQPSIHPQAAFTRGWRIGRESFPDRLSNTLLIVTARDSVPWTKPDELQYDPAGPLPPLGGHQQGHYSVLMADGNVRLILSDTLPESTLRALITRNGEEMISQEDW